MIVQLRSSIGSTAARQARRQRTRALTSVDLQLAQIRRTAAVSLRCGIVLLALLSLHWGPITLTSLPAILAALALGAVALALGHKGWLLGWTALTGDALVVCLLLYGTGRAGSPLLALTMVLVLQGALLGESVGALAGSVVGVTILVLQNAGYHHPINAIVADLAVIHLALGVITAWLWQRIAHLLLALRADAGQNEQEAREIERGRHLMHWQRLNLQLAACTTIEELLGRAASHAQSITGATADIRLDGAPEPEHRDDAGSVTHMVFSCGGASGRITIYRPACELGMSQRDAIEQLATLVGLRVAKLRALVAQERQQTALTALWETSGLLRVASVDRDLVRDALARLAAVLDLDWLGLLAPDARHMLAPVAVARGRRGGAAPLFSSAQIRVAAEALRGERPLVRTEGAESLVCLPICRAGQPPVVIAARGSAGDAATQTLLMLFGDIVAGRLSDFTGPTGDPAECDTVAVRVASASARPTATAA